MILANILRIFILKKFQCGVISAYGAAAGYGFKDNLIEATSLTGVDKVRSSAIYIPKLGMRNPA